jgi:T-complex protein 11
MLARGRLSHPRYPSGGLDYGTLPRNRQIYLATLRGMLDLVFNPPLSASSSSVASSTPPPTPVFQTSSSSLNVYPETLYLDSARLALLSSEAADATALYMFLLLYRQLVFSESNEAPSSPHGVPKVLDADLTQLKREIRDIGPSRLSHCFTSPPSPSDDSNGPHGGRSDRKEAERWLAARQGVVLQIAKRAKETQNRTRTPSPSQPSSLIGEAPDEHTASLAQRWAASNMHANSTLAVMLRRRLQDIVFNTVIKLAYPVPGSSMAKRGTVDFFASARADSAVDMSLGKATGMEPLTDEIRALSEKISRLSLIHLNAFLPLYEQEGFLQLS